MPAEAVEEVDGVYYFQGQKVNREYGKMGKSLKNSVTPDEFCDTWGADTLRVYEMSMGPLEVSRPWETKAVSGSFRFLQRRLAQHRRRGDRTTYASPPTSRTCRRCAPCT